MKLSTAQIADICGRYGYTYVSTGAINSGYRNTSYQVMSADARVLNLIVHKADELTVRYIRAHHELGAALAARGLPVRAPIDRRILCMKSGARVRYAALYTYLPGETILWEAYTRSHVKLLGYALAMFHAATRELRGVALADVEVEYDGTVKCMQRYFTEQDTMGALQEKCGVRVDTDVLATYARFIAKCRRLPGRIPLHMDFVRGNVLFADDVKTSVLRVGHTTLTGIIDLEKAAIGHLYWDVARTLAFLLVDCPRARDKTYQYFLNSGYIKRGQGVLRPLSVDGRDMLETLIDMFLAYDFYKFLRDNPYESLANNHHFVRTRDILLERGLLY